MFVYKENHPKTQRSIIKVADNTQYAPAGENKVVSENDFAAHSSLIV